MNKVIKRVQSIPRKAVPVAVDNIPSLQLDRIDPKQLAVTMVAALYREYTGGRIKVPLTNMANIVLYITPCLPTTAIINDSKIQVMSNDSFMIYYNDQWETSMSFTCPFVYSYEHQNMYLVLCQYYETLADKINSWIESHRTKWDLRYAKEVRERYGR